MPKLEYNFKDDQLDLMIYPEGTDVDVTDFDPISGQTGDYIRVSIFTSDGDFIHHEVLDPQTDIFQDSHGRFFVKPSELLERLLFGKGNYTLKFDFLNDYSTVTTEYVPETDVSCYDVGLLLTDGSFSGFYDVSCEDILPSDFEHADAYDIVARCREADSQDDIFEVMYDADLGVWNYYNGTLACDQADISAVPIEYFSDIFFIKEISPSRKEVRLGYRGPNDEIVDIETDTGYDNFTETVGDPTTDSYFYDWVLTLPGARSIPIVNYVFDTRLSTSSLILRLNAPIPSDISRLQKVRVSNEVLTTQTIQIYFETPRIGIPIIGGTGVEKDGVISIGTEYEGDLESESYNEMISGSTLDITRVENIHSGSFKNLNIDYTQFSNHVFFGSATKKLENFRTKVKIIEDSLMSMSSSFHHSGSSFIDLRTQKFKKIRETINEFTPYERFLYFDSQFTSTGSAPGIGRNLAKSHPLSSGSSTHLSTYDGIDNVYRVDTGGSGSDHIINIFDQNRAEDPNFGNYSGSVYLSFLMRAPAAWMSGSYAGDGIPAGINLKNINAESAHYNQHGIIRPSSCFSSQSVYVSTGSNTVTGSGYRRFVFAASQSHWRPSGSGALDSPPQPISTVQFIQIPATNFEVLSSSLHVQSASSVAGTAYGITAHDEHYARLLTHVTASGVPVSGSILPSGDLFRMEYKIKTTNTSAVTSSYFADVRMTTTDPTKVPPFGTVFQTGSSEWQDWYNGMHDSASSFDDDNIHSLVNNLPRQVRTNPESTDLKKFINMVGEQYDIIRNHIDNYEKFYSRKYKKVDAMPDNLLPILADNLGWNVIQPFSSSLADYFRTTTDDVNSQEQITFNTWRKVINNLTYIYKSKGTLSSVRALLNVYGYPSDQLQIHELGGSAEQQVGYGAMDDDPSPRNQGIGGSTQLSPSYIENTTKIYSYVFNEENYENRTLKIDWGVNDVSNPETIEFVMNPDISTNTQIILENSGSGAEKLWDLRLENSGSKYNLGKLAFRLSHARSGSFGDITSSGSLVMSTSYLDFKSGDRIWNVMLQSMTSSITSSGVQTYKLYVGEQAGDRIRQLEAVSMSVSGGLERESALTGSYYANENWRGSGSLNATASGNLIVGRTFSGSIAEIRTWNETLSASIFKQHILNKRSIVGNTETSSMHKMYYNFKLGENHPSGTANPKAKDSNPKNVKDYSKNISSDILTGSISAYRPLYLVTYTFSPRFGGSDQINDNKVIIEPTESTIGDLSPVKSSIRTKYDEIDKSKIRSHSTKIKITRSPTTILDSFIIDNVPDLDISDKIGDPNSIFSGSYNDLDSFRYDIMTHFDIKVDINKWIRANETTFKPHLIQGIQSILPTRTTTDGVGLSIEQTILERNRIESPRATVLTGSDAGRLSSNAIVISQSLTDSSYDSIKEGEYKVYDNMLTSSEYLVSKDGEYEVINNIITSSEYIASKNGEYEVSNNILTSSEYIASKNAEYGISDNITVNSEYLATKNAVNSYITSQSIRSFINYGPAKYESGINVGGIWGTGSNDTHFVNYAYSASGNPDTDTFYNWDHWEIRDTFTLVGDVEGVSGSAYLTGSEYGWETKFDNPDNFLNREIRDKGKGYIYKSYVVADGSDPDSGLGYEGRVDGRPVGKTAYYTTRSSAVGGDGDFVYPSNHWINFVDDMRTTFHNGYKNGEIVTFLTGSAGNPLTRSLDSTHLDYFPHPVYEDLSTASFYSVDVGDYSDIIVKKGVPSLTKQNIGTINRTSN